MKTAREKAFKALKGITIEKVSAKAVNQLVIKSTDGRKFTVDVEVEGGIPVMHLTEAFSFKNEKPIQAKKLVHDYD